MNNYISIAEYRCKINLINEAVDSAEQYQLSRSLIVAEIY